MDDNRVSIEKIIKNWKGQIGVKRISPMGTDYVVLPKSNMREHLIALAQMMLDHGYTLEEVNSHRVSVKLVDIAWREDKIVKMSSTEIKRAKYSLALDWDEALASFIDIKVPEVKDTMPKEEARPVQQSVAKTLDKKDSSGFQEFKPKADLSNIPDPEFDEEILAELAAIGTIVDKTK